MNANTALNPICSLDPVECRSNCFLAAMLFATVFTLTPHMTSLAQTLDNEETIETIVGSEVDTEEQDAASVADRVREAINNTPQMVEKALMAFSLDELKIVFLSDIDNSEINIDKLIAQHQSDITDLRKAIEGNAMFFHSVDSRAILLSDIVALEFDEDHRATIFVSGEKPR